MAAPGWANARFDWGETIDFNKVLFVKTSSEHSANPVLDFEEEIRNASLSSRYSLSLFTLEINGKPKLCFRSKRHAEAERIGRDWVYSHKDQISSKGRHGSELPPLISVRIALAAERAAFEAGSDSAELYDGVRIVKVIEAAERQDGSQDGEPDTQAS